MKVISRTAILCSILFYSSIFASEIATTIDGRKVELNKDGTYAYISDDISDNFKKIDFTDFMIDSEVLVGKKVIIRGTGGFRNDGNKKYPSGSIYQKIFTIGPSISIQTS